MLIGMELVEEFVSTAILSGRLQHESPVSILLIAAPESGKTSIALEKPCKAVMAFTDVTGRGLMEICRLNGDVTHIIINDLVPVMSHRSSVNQYTISVINSMTEEGIQAVAYPKGIEKYDAGKRAIIACLTLDLANDGRAWWNRIGLASRLLPFSFDHPPALQIRIKKLIQDDKRNGHGSAKLEAQKELFVPDGKILVTVPDKLKPEILKLSDFKAKQLGDPKGYRRLKQFTALAKAHALRRSWKLKEVGQEDIEFLHRIDPYISYTECKPL